ncbi:SdpI family protein [Geobacillus sp. C56-T3]|uniref:SdpI family protein n=1 Tax=Geobacillus sp. (strain C56-T3) TaxID=691437 RepID=UPI00059DB073|nr:SdpI family protein [Geobacillus sp. C56-T3]
MMKVSRLAIVLTVLAYFLSLAALPYLPDEVAIHWSASGEADGFSNKWLGAFLPPLLMTFLIMLMGVLPKFDPKKESYGRFQKSYGIVNAALACFFLLLHIATLAYNLGVSVDIGRLVPLGVGALLIVLGNYMPKIKPNYFIGIRTPWTLESETVWNKTHRLGGKVFIVMGMLLMLTAFSRGDIQFVLLMLVIVFGNLYLIVQSFLYFRKEQRKRS